MFRRAVHPGEILKDELDELSVSPTALARSIDVPPNRISQITAGKRSITGDTALRLGHWFGVDPQFWLEPPGTVRPRRSRTARRRGRARIAGRAPLTTAQGHGVRRKPPFSRGREKFSGERQA